MAEVLVGPDSGFPQQLEGFTPVIDEDVVSVASTAQWGYRIPATGEAGEVFLDDRHLPGMEHTVLEVYPLDGRDRPISVTCRNFGYSEEEIVRAIQIGLLSRSQSEAA